jgi:hypothetical protein
MAYRFSEYPSRKRASKKGLFAGVGTLSAVLFWRPGYAQNYVFKMENSAVEALFKTLALSTRPLRYPA